MSWCRLSALVALLLALLSAPAEAHPHVFVDAKTEVVFNDTGRVSAVRHIWQFDEAFTQYAIQGLDADNDGKLSDAELKPLADTNVKSLKEFEFFTYLTVGRDTAKFLPPKEYWLEFHGGRLTLFYTLPLEKPMVTGKHAMLEIFDPEYFVAFTFIKKDPIKLINAPTGCTSIYKPPRELDASTMSVLAAIPADQHDLPPELRQAASVLSNHVTISCPLPADVKAPASASAEAAQADVGATAGGERALAAADALVKSDAPGGSGDARASAEAAQVEPPPALAPAAQPSAPAATAAADPAPAIPGRPAESASAAVASEPPPRSDSSFPIFGVALFLVAVGGGVVALVLQRRPARSR